MRNGVLRLSGHQNFRYRLLLAILSQRSIIIHSIRSNSEDPGIKDYEVSFLRLVERVTNGTIVEINYTGTEVYVKPGLVMGGSVVHQCPESRAVGWFAEPLLLLGLFGKQELKLTLRGITSNARDVSVSFHQACFITSLPTAATAAVVPVVRPTSFVRSSFVHEARAFLLTALATTRHIN